MGAAETPRDREALGAVEEGSELGKAEWVVFICFRRNAELVILLLCVFVCLLDERGSVEGEG